MKLLLPEVFSQNDPSYKNEKLGTSTVLTIGSHGCLLSCGATACRYFGKDTNPSKLNKDMKAVNGFVGGGNWMWGALTDVYSDIKFDWDIWEKGDFYSIPADLGMIDRLLGENLPVFVHVDFNPGGEVEQHWVLIKGKENNSFICQDPWPYPSEEYFFEARYGDPERYIFAVRVYRGPVASPPESDLELHKKVDQLVESLSNVENSLKLNTNSISDLKGDVDDVKRDTEELYKDRETIIKIKEEVVRLEGTVKESINKQTTIETGIKAEIRKIYDFINKGTERIDGDREELEKRVKELENRPIPLDDKVKILVRLKNLFIGRIIKGGDEK